MYDIEVVPTQFKSEGESIIGNFVLPKIEGPFPGICKFHGLLGGPVSICTAVRDSRVNAVCLRAPVYDTLNFAEKPFFRNLPNEVYKEMAKDFKGIDNPNLRTRILDQLIEDSKIYNPINEIHQLAPKPLFITTGGKDEVIDVGGVRRLFEKAREPKEFLLVENADHLLNEVTSRNLTQDAIIKWFKKQVSE